MLQRYLLQGSHFLGGKNLLEHLTEKTSGIILDSSKNNNRLAFRNSVKKGAKKASGIIPESAKITMGMFGDGDGWGWMGMGMVRPYRHFLTTDILGTDEIQDTKLHVFVKCTWIC